MLLQVALCHSFLWLSSIPLYIYNIFSIHSSTCGHLTCFHILAIVNRAAMNTGVHISFWIIVLSGYMPRSGVSEPYGNLIFSFLRNLSISFTVAASTYFPTNSVLYLTCSLLFVDFLMMNILTGVNLYLNVVLFCIRIFFFCFVSEAIHVSIY